MTTYASLLNPDDVNVHPYGDNRIGVQFLDDEGNSVVVQGSIRSLATLFGRAHRRVRDVERGLGEAVDHQLDALAERRQAREEYLAHKGVTVDAPIDEGPF